MAESKQDGGPAFPGGRMVPGDFTYQGMSLRDWFAGQVTERELQALEHAVAEREAAEGVKELVTPEAIARRLSRIRWIFADAMLAERERQP